MSETSITGICPICGGNNIVLREIDEQTAFQYCVDCQWAEEKDWFSLSYEGKMEKLVRKEEAKKGWTPYVRLDCGGAWTSTRRKSDNGWEENVAHSCWNCQHVKIVCNEVVGCKAGQMKAPRQGGKE